MLITMLKGLRRTDDTPAPRPHTRPTRRTTVVDLSGPLPEAKPAPKPAPKKVEHPYRENAMVAAALRPTTFRSDVTEMSRLPRDLDPFEADFPWIGWVEPKHESVIRSEFRSPTFEQDLERVLRIFAN